MNSSEVMFMTWIMIVRRIVILGQMDRIEEENVEIHARMKSV